MKIRTILTCASAALLLGSVLSVQAAKVPLDPITVKITATNAGQGEFTVYAPLTATSGALVCADRDLRNCGQTPPQAIRNVKSWFLAQRGEAADKSTDHFDYQGAINSFFSYRTITNEGSARCDCNIQLNAYGDEVAATCTATSGFTCGQPMKQGISDGVYQYSVNFGATPSK